jgi:hypothetical protein
MRKHLVDLMGDHWELFVGLVEIDLLLYNLVDWLKFDPSLKPRKK